MLPVFSMSAFHGFITNLDNALTSDSSFGSIVDCSELTGSSKQPPPSRSSPSQSSLTLLLGLAARLGLKTTSQGRSLRTIYWNSDSSYNKLIWQVNEIHRLTSVPTSAGSFGCIQWDARVSSVDGVHLFFRQLRVYPLSSLRICLLFCLLLRVH